MTEQGPRFKPGDKVILKTLDEIDKRFHYNLTKDYPMKQKFLGKTVTIKESSGPDHFCFDDYYLIEEDDYYCWFEDMILKVVPPGQKKYTQTLPSV